MLLFQSILWLCLATMAYGGYDYYVSGQFTCQGKPLIGRVYLYEDDFVSDDYVDEGTLDENGGFYLYGYLDDGWPDGSVEPYLEIYHQCGHPGRQCVKTVYSLENYRDNPLKLGTMRIDILGYEKMAKVYHSWYDCQYVMDNPQPYTP
ncbi:unnamed protein product [Bursaphelenchus okinawaensis]|uniref:Uncharacterized protein n=1 Tax=Bursaphelenchus okinawaensis TaxID=465554 RepID=A0A811KUN5_9BILA|nr:unnamed protein product [Bursaphelenchus okinawaensis]CAG9111051.1 unnamed protein product [Bursaphelenchus okinawaensis]